MIVIKRLKLHLIFLFCSNIPSCSGCKTFFRRAITNNRVFKCMGNGACPVNKDVRCACRCCRLLKCLAVGKLLKYGIAILF